MIIYCLYIHTCVYRFTSYAICTIGDSSNQKEIISNRSGGGGRGRAGGGRESRRGRGREEGEQEGEGEGGGGGRGRAGGGRESRRRVVQFSDEIDTTTRH